MGSKKGKKQRKHGRNKAWCAGYRAAGLRLKHKLVRLRKHICKHPDDRAAAHAVTQK